MNSNETEHGYLTDDHGHPSSMRRMSIVALIAAIRNSQRPGSTGQSAWSGSRWCRVGPYPNGRWRTRRWRTLAVAQQRPVPTDLVAS